MKALKYALHAGVLIGLVWAGMKYVNGGEFWAAMRSFDWTYLPYIIACTAVYFVLKGVRFVILFRKVSRVPIGLLLRAFFAGQAFAVLPGGMAARAGLLKEAGVPVSTSGAVIALTSLSDGAALVFGALISALWFDAARKPALFILSGLILVSAVLGVEASRAWLLGLVDRLMGRFGILEHWRELLDCGAEIFSARMAAVSLGITLLALMVIVLALELCTAGVGAMVPYSTDWLAVTLPGLLGRMSAMPAGVGVTEAGMVSILDSTPGVRLDQAAAAVTMFRVWTILLEVVIGALVYFLAWRGAAERRAAAEPAVSA